MDAVRLRFIVLRIWLRRRFMIWRLNMWRVLVSSEEYLEKKLFCSLLVWFISRMWIVIWIRRVRLKKCCAGGFMSWCYWQFQLPS